MMTLKLYNSFTNTIEDFVPVIPGKVRIYNCGPTVYSYQHIGNFRSFVQWDLLRRYLIHKGFDVIQVMNITDVGHLTDDSDDGEDKMETAARKEKKHPLEIAEFYTKQFLDDWKTLNLLEPEFRPKATQTIPEMIAMVEHLLKEGFAYEAGGNVYFDISKFGEYGKLSGNSLDKLTKRRVDIDTNKKSPHDFVLWFGNSKFKNHILKWDSPWGEGYPGWHMECSAMSAKFLGDAFADGSFHPEKFETIDIHTGGEDNKFPHHECEIAQTECATKKQFSKYWLHSAFMMSEGQKMSKSIGNIYTVFDLVAEGFDPRAIRYVLLATHYRMQMNFTKEGIVSAQSALSRVDETLRKLDLIKEEKPFSERLSLYVHGILLGIEKELNNDFNISGALAALFEGVKEINKFLQEGKIGNHQAKEILEILFRVDSIFGLFPKSLLDKEDLPKEIVDILEERRSARENKNWAKSDELRDFLTEKGYEVKDTKEGQECRKL
jgi:cysteinyl-tRNA synthetase